jgi:hypothetical protein
MGTDVRQIAKLLQAKAPPHHKLAFINDAEDALLRSKGAKGLPYKDTGIPNYTGAQIDVSAPDAGLAQAQASDANLPPPTTQSAPSISAGGGEDTTQVSSEPSISQTSTPSTLGTPGAVVGQGGADFGGDVPLPQVAGTPTAGYQSALQDTSLFPSQGQPSGTETQISAGQPAVAVPEQPVAQADKTQPSKPMSQDTMARLGLGGLQALLGASQVRKAQAQGQQASTAEQALAAPYQQQGQQLQAAAQRGELTPQNQQILQAARAQLAQGVASRGGVGAQQATNQLASITQNLLQNQMNLGLQLQQVGDKVAIGAIQAGVQADQYVNQLTSAYANNIGAVLLGGMPSSTVGGKPVATPPQQ